MVTKNQKLALGAATGVAAALALWQITGPNEYDSPAVRIEGECGMPDPDGVHNDETGATAAEIRGAVKAKTFAKRPAKELDHIGRCLEALKSDDGRLTSKEALLLREWANGYIAHLFAEKTGGRELTQEEQDTRAYLEILASYIITTLGDSPESAEQIEALKRLYDMTHGKLPFFKTEFDPDELKRPGSVIDSDAGLLSRFFTDLLIQIHDSLMEHEEDPKKAYGLYKDALVQIEKALREVGFAFDASKHAEAARYFKLDTLKLGLGQTDPRLQVFELMDRYRRTDSMTGEELKERPDPDRTFGDKFADGVDNTLNWIDGAMTAGAGAIDTIWSDVEEENYDKISGAAKRKLARGLLAMRSYQEVLTGLSTQEPDTIGVFFDGMFSMAPDEATERFEKDILGNRALMAQSARNVWLPEGSDSSWFYDVIVERGNTDPAQALTVKTTLWILGLDTETIRHMVTEYQSHQSQIEKPLSGEAIAEVTWNRESDGLHDTVEDWVIANLTDEFRGKLGHETWDWLDEAAAGSTIFVPYAGVIPQTVKSWIDYKAMVDANEDLGVVDTAEATGVTAFTIGNEMTRFWVAASSFAAKGKPMIPVPKGVVGAWIITEGLDLWFDPQLDPDRGWTRRQERGEGFVDSLSEKFRLLLLGLMGWARVRRKKWHETGYLKRIVAVGYPAAIAIDGVTSIAKKISSGVRRVCGTMRDWGVDENELASAIDAFDTADEAEVDSEEDPFGDANADAVLDEVLRSARSSGKSTGRSEPER